MFLITASPVSGTARFLFCGLSAVGQQLIATAATGFRASRLAETFGFVEGGFQGGKCLAGFFNLAGQLLFKGDQRGFHIGKTLILRSEAGLHMFADGGHRLMHIIQARIVADLFTAENGFHLVGQAVEHRVGTVFHLLEPDINQEIYGLPEYLSALNSAWLNESATLFRRKYYQNGAHAGYIMYVTDPAQSATDVESLRDAMRNSKGLGNFKNLFFYSPNGKPDGIKIVPLSEVATKDDFFNIKKASAADLMDAHRVPFQLMGGKPENIGSLGDVEKVAKVFVRNELSPLQDRFREVNDWLGMEVIRFKEYTLDNPE